MMAPLASPLVPVVPPLVLCFDDLRQLSRLGPRATLATVERWAQSSGIRYKYDGRGGIWTTMDALNAALGMMAQHAPAGDAPIAAEALF